MKKLGICILLLVVVLASSTMSAQATWMRLIPQVHCQKVSITPSTVVEGYSIIMVNATGCETPQNGPATVIVWTPFGNSGFGYESQTGSLLSGRTSLSNGNFMVILAVSGAYAGDWDIMVTIWQGNQVVNSGSAGVLTVIKAPSGTCTCKT